VRDVVAGALAAETRGRVGERYLLGGRWRSVVEFAGVVRQVTGVKVPRITCPMALARVGAPFMDAWGHVTGREPLFTTESLHALRSNRAISSAKAARELGYACRPLEETIRDSVAWFREAGMLPPAQQAA
jgi:dihydroflavonol-4-reductase